MIIDGLLISVIGIGMVFTIFIVLIILMNITSAIMAFLDKKFPDKTIPKMKPSIRAQSTVSNTEDPLVAIAIAAAKQHEERKI